MVQQFVDFCSVRWQITLVDEVLKKVAKNWPRDVESIMGSGVIVGELIHGSERGGI
jgi:hypothetical protein